MFCKSFVVLALSLGHVLDGFGRANRVRPAERRFDGCANRLWLRPSRAQKKDRRSEIRRSFDALRLA
jgi:hypothetical protein